MVCAMVKKAVVGGALGAGALALIFGTSAPSYVRTAFHKVRHDAKSAVPVQFEIDRARQEVADLEPSIHKSIEAVAEAQVEIGALEREIAATRQNLEKEGRQVVALRNVLGTGDTLRTGGVSYSPDEIKHEIARKMDHVYAVESILKEREETLKLRQKNVSAVREQLESMRAAKVALATKIEGIEARLRQIEATQAASEFSIDDSALSRVKQTVNDLDKRLEVMAKVNEAEGRYSEKSIPVIADPGRDILKEVDAKFGLPAKDSSRASNDKNL